MRKFELIAPCHFGMEAVLKNEIIELGYDITEVADGRITFWGDEEALCRANIFLRTAERILIKIGRFTAETYEELFQGTKALAWEDFFFFSLDRPSGLQNLSSPTRDGTWPCSESTEL